MSDTMIVVIGIFVTLLLLGGVGFTVVEFRKMYDPKSNQVKAKSPKPEKRDLENY